MAEMTVIPVATHGFFLDGKWLEEGDIVDVRAPYDGALIAHVYQGRREHAEAAIAAAVKAFGTTRRLPAFERQRVLRQIATGIHDRKEEFSRTIALEAGKPIKSARTELTALFLFSTSPPKRRFAATANICRWIGSSRPPGVGASSNVFPSAPSPASRPSIFL